MMTTAAEPLQPPGNVCIEPVDFQQVRICWEPPEEETLKCDQVELSLQYSNSNGQRGTVTFSLDGTKEIKLDSLPGTRWEAKMRTQTVESVEEPKYSEWSPPVVLVTQVPTGAPHSLGIEGRQDTKLAFGWEPPEYIERNGKISQYEYELTGIDEWNQGTRESVSPRTRADIGDLMPGSLYRFKVRAFTSSAGPGPWSEPIDARTTEPEKPLGNVRIEPVGFEHIRVFWEPPEKEIRKFGLVELALQDSNSIGQRTVTFSPDGPKEIKLDSLPGTRWEAKMRTQTVESGKVPKYSGWSPSVVLVTQFEFNDKMGALVSERCSKYLYYSTLSGFHLGGYDENFIQHRQAQYDPYGHSKFIITALTKTHAVTALHCLNTQAAHLSATIDDQFTIHSIATPNDSFKVKVVKEIQRLDCVLLELVDNKTFPHWPLVQTPTRGMHVACLGFPTFGTVEIEGNLIEQQVRENEPAPLVAQVAALDYPEADRLVASCGLTKGYSGSGLFRVYGRSDFLLGICTGGQKPPNMPDTDNWHHHRTFSYFSMANVLKAYIPEEYEPPAKKRALKQKYSMK